jgi:type I restriction enzyme S subunit
MSYYDGDVNWVCSYDLHETEITETGKTLSEKGAALIAGELQSPNSILIAMYGGSGTIGNSGLLKCYARTNQAICSVHFDEVSMDPRFAFYQTMFIRKYWMYYAVGTRKDPNISQDVVRNMKYVIPPIEEQKSMVALLDEKCSQIDRLIAIKEAKIEKLEQYKKSLIYEYVTGKKEVH